MRNKKIAIFLCLFFLAEIQVLSQNQYLNKISDRIMQLSPQTYDFIKYGNTNIGYFTGETNVKIPIYTYKDDDFELPIYLGYNSSGFIPNKREGIVGLNWYLNAGGVITRKVNGFPDDQQGIPGEIPTPTLHGLYYGIKNNLNVKYTSLNNIFNFNNCGEVSFADYWHIDDCEVEPDEFSFSMPGYSGSFFIENNGAVHCSGNLPYKVDLTNFSIQEYAEEEIAPSEILIVTDNGYKYYFGGDIQFLEVSFPLGTSYLGDDGTYNGFTRGTINAWHLNRIVAPNGREVVFSYKTFHAGFWQHDSKPVDSNHYLLNYYQLETNDMSQYSLSYYCFLGGHLRYSSFQGGGGTKDVFEDVKTVYLNKIQIGKTSINLDYEEKEKAFYTFEYASPFNQKNLQLKEINVNVEGIESPIKSYTFKLESKGGTYGDRLFLTSFQELGQNPYAFTYYKTDLIPSPKTHGIDYWGFWNGGYSENSRLIPETSFTTQEDLYNGVFEYTSSEREPDSTKCDVGLLEKIIYPTGGSTTFYYQNHTYSQRLERRIDNSFMPALYPVTGIAGGARIWKVVDNDGLNDVNTREFKYVEDDPAGTTASGILLDWPRYIYAWKYDDENAHQVMIKKKSISFNSNYSPGENYIQYSQVFELLVPNDGYTQYKFTNYVTNPNINDINSTPVDQEYYDHTTNRDLYNNYIGMRYNNTSFERGIPYEINQYAKVNGLYKPVMKKKIDVFTTCADYTNNFAVGVFQSGAIAQSYKIYYYPFLTKKETITNYSANGDITTTSTEDMQYNNYNQLIESKTNQSDNSYSIKKYKYISDLAIVDYCTNQITTCKNEASELYNQCINSNPEHTTECVDTRAVMFEQCDEDYSTCTHDYSENYTSISEMQSKHMLSGLVEEQSLNQKGTEIKLNSGSLIEYKDFGGDILKPYKVNRLEQMNSSTDLTQAYINSTADFIYNSNYKPAVIMDSYDDKGNLLQLHQVNGIYKSYIWGYNKTQPIAEVKNAKVNEIFFTSYEEDEDFPNLTYKCITDSHSGKQCYMIPAGDFNKAIDFPKSALHGKYVYSAWVKTLGTGTFVTIKDFTNGTTSAYSWTPVPNTNDQWNYFEAIADLDDASYNSSNNIRVEVWNSGSTVTYVDDVRFRPLNSQMTTYTYQPLVGMSSSTDDNNRTTYYEYDDLGRLLNTRDEDRNILSHNEYNYINSLRASVAATQQGNNLFTLSITGSNFNCSNYTYEWDFGDNNVLTNSQLCSLNHQYSVSSSSNYTVTVKLFSGSDLVKTLTTTAQCVENWLITHTLDGNCHYSFELSGNINSNLTYEWNFGDGTIVSNSTLTTISHQYPINFGVSYTVTAKVYNGTTLLSTATTSVTFEESCLLTGYVAHGSTFNFSISGSCYYGSEYTYVWDYGDGSSVETTTNASSSHAYAESGTYDAVVSIRLGETEIKSLTIPVEIE